MVATVNKRPAYVVQCLKLNDLIPGAKDAVQQGKLLLGHASELARLRTQEQEAALKWLLRQSKDVRTSDGWKKTHVIPGVPELRLWIQQTLFLDPRNAPFDTADPNLSPSMGACTDCQFRTGNQPALFGDIKRRDICTAAPCWLAKRNATIVNLAAATAKELGVKSVLKVGIGHASWNDPKVPVDAYIEYGSEARIVKQGSECPHTKPCVITWMAHPGDAGTLKVGDTVLVCTQAVDCPVHKKVDSRVERPKKSFEQMADTRIANLRKDLPQRIRAALIRSTIENALKRCHSLSTADKVKFELAANQMHADLFFDRHRDLCKLMEVEPTADRKGPGKDWRGSTRKMFQGHPVEMMVAVVLMHRYHVGHNFGPDTDPLKPLLRLYRVEAKSIERRIREDTAAKIASIQATLKKRGSKQANQIDPSSAHPAERKGQTRPSNESVE